MENKAKLTLLRKEDIVAQPPVSTEEKIISKSPFMQPPNVNCPVPMQIEQAENQNEPNGLPFPDIDKTHKVY